ncbi:MAG: M1 family peptidase [Pseudonocardiaceae bacterium]|nr:M1 family peptidase [Pseudonocardiaceae bacterium]
MSTSGRQLATISVALLALTACTGEQADAPRSGTAQPGRPGHGSSGAGDSYYPNDGNGGYDVTDYHVAVDYTPESGRLDGDTTVTATGTDRLARFNLDLTGLRVNSVEVNGKEAGFRRRGGELVITAPVPIEAGTRFQARVRYAGRPKPLDSGELGTSGWQRSRSGGAFAIGQPHSATAWYPVNDTPRDKATFRLTARVPSGWSVVSNGAEGHTDSANGWTTYRWMERNPIASYLTTIGVDRWTLDRSRLRDGTPVVNAYAPGAEHKRSVQRRLPEVLEFLSGKFGEYPQSAAGGIFLAEDVGYSLETQTRPTYTWSSDLETLVHESAHEWYGNSVSLRSWADICLNECVASYAQWLWSEAKEGKNLNADYRRAIDRYRDDSDFWSSKLYDPGAGHEFEGVYDKGILAMHALRMRIGDQAFNRVLREWPARHRGGNATLPGFERFVQRVSGDDLRGFFDAWFRGTEIPADQYL